MNQIVWLEPENLTFPDSANALSDPNGLLAAGGDLSIDRLFSAYSRGIFPWYSEGQPIMWWSPHPRMVLLPNKLHIGRSLRKLARKKHFQITVNKAFTDVIQACAAVPRGEGDGTWITDDMKNAYIRLHHAKLAHSVEAWHDGKLAGGLYGVCIGKVFFGESMFSRVSGASKIAFTTLALQLRDWQFEAIDCQVYSDYLQTFGASEIPRQEFERILQNAGIFGAMLKDEKDYSSDAAIDDYGVIHASDTPVNPCWKTCWTMPEYGFD